MFSESPPFSGSMLPLDLAGGVSVFSKSPSCQLIVSFNKDPSEIHHGLVIDRLAPTDAYKDLYLLKAFWISSHDSHPPLRRGRERGGGREIKEGERKAGKDPLLSPPEAKDMLVIGLNCMRGEERRGEERRDFR